MPESNDKQPVGYEGQIVDGMPHGYGKQNFSNGDRYEGIWKKGKPNGKGLYMYASGARYEGVLENGLRHGRGKYLYSNGQVYDGDWVQGKRTGHGVFCSNKNVPAKQADWYEGGFQDGIQHGKGTLRLASGEAYRGDFVHGIRKGVGQLKLADGNEYRGQFNNDVPDGFGAFLSMQLKGRKLVGHFAKGTMIKLLCYKEGEIRRDAATCEYDATTKKCKKCGFAEVPLPVLSSVGQASATEQPKRPATAPVKVNPSPSSAGDMFHRKFQSYAKKQLTQVKAGLGMSIANVGDSVRVVEVGKGSSAEELGLQRGDYIVSVNGNEISKKQDVCDFLEKHTPGEVVRLQYLPRYGSIFLEANVTLGANLAASDIQFLTQVVDGSVVPRKSDLEFLSSLKALPYCQKM